MGGGDLREAGFVVCFVLYLNGIEHGTFFSRHCMIFSTTFSIFETASPSVVSVVAMSLALGISTLQSKGTGKDEVEVNGARTSPVDVAASRLSLPLLRQYLSHSKVQSHTLRR